MVQPIVERHLIHVALDALQRICVAELQFESPAFDQSLRFAIGAVLDITQPTALSHLEAQAINGLNTAMVEGNAAKVNEYREVIREFNDKLWSRFVAIGTAAAKTKSFGLFDVNTNIAEIVKHGLWLLSLLSRTQPKEVDPSSAHQAWLHQGFADDVLKDLKWIVGATYWRIFDALEPPININVVWDFFPTLSHIGIQALDANVPSLAESAISELRSISLKLIDKPVQILETAARVAVFIARIGIVAQKLGEKKTLDVSIVALKDFQRRYYDKQKEMEPAAESHEAVLLGEIDDLKSDLRKDHWFLDEEDSSFFGRVSSEDIDTFVASVSLG